MKNFILDLLFPKRCLGCREFDTWLCDRCFSLIRPNQTQWCYICREQNEDGRTCSSHLHTDAPRRVSTLDGLVIAAHYDGNPLLKKAIKELKYHRRADVGEKLAQLYRRMAMRLYRRDESRLYEFIPVPLHKNRLKKRGFNQAELLARSVQGQGSSGEKFRTLDSGLLTRTKETPSQVECRDRQTRLKNPRDAFTLNGEIDPEKTYILVDDLVTTGATLEECCRVLKTSGARTVWGLVLARN